jgi:hypothetical protein
MAGGTLAESLEADSAAPVISAARPTRRRWVTGFSLAGIVLFTAYLVIAHDVPVMSDGASNALQAFDMLHGNFFLHGWTLTDISFWPTELPELAIAEGLRGLGQEAANIASAFTYTLVVLGAALLAKGRADGREGLVRVLIAGGIMLAPTLPSTASTLLNDPDHTGTQVPMLIIWMILDRARPRWYVPVAVTLLLAWVQVADPLVTYEGVLAIAVVCLVRLYWQRADFAAGFTAGLRAHWYEAALTAGAIVSTGLSALTIRLISVFGGFKTSPPNTTFIDMSDFAYRISVTAKSILVIFGADFSSTNLGASAFVPLIHLVGVGLATWGLARALRRFAVADLMVQVLAVGAVILIAAFTFSGAPDAVSGPHEIVALVPIGAILAARLLTGQLIRGRHLSALALALVCYVGVLGYEVAQPPEPDVNAQLASWLEAHHLSYGLASYWNASSVSVDSGGKVEVRPVNLSRGYIQAIRRDANPAWYGADWYDANFLIVPSDTASCSAGSTADWLNSAYMVFGPPSAAYSVDGVDVLVYQHENLLSRVWPAGGGEC